MAILNIELLKKIIETIPEDYILEYDKGTTTVPIEDRVENRHYWSENYF